MPRPGPRRPNVNVRIGEVGLAAIDAQAAEHRRTRSQMIRLFLALGLERWIKATPGQRQAWSLAHGLADKVED